MSHVRRQRTALQLETLTEFVEHHLYGTESRCCLTVFDRTENHGNNGENMLSMNGMKNDKNLKNVNNLNNLKNLENVKVLKLPDLDRVDMLVEVCLELPQGGIMRDWSTIISLLLRESEDLISSALRPVLSSILLRIFVCSAKNLRDWYFKVRSMQMDDINDKNNNNMNNSMNNSMNNMSMNEKDRGKNKKILSLSSTRLNSIEDQNRPQSGGN